MTRIALIAAITLGLAACTGTGADHAAPPAAAATTHAPAVASSSSPARSVLAAMPDFTGIGPLRFGMDAAQVRKAWGLPLYGETQPKDPQACYFMSPREQGGDLLLMIEGDRFVRVDVKSAGKTAPGGGRVGMHLAQIEQLYAGRTSVIADKYDAAAKVISVAAPDHAGAYLVFETDATGVVKAWHIGVTPQVNYVEGCG